MSTSVLPMSTPLSNLYHNYDNYGPHDADGRLQPNPTFVNYRDNFAVMNRYEEDSLEQESFEDVASRVSYPYNQLHLQTNPQQQPTPQQQPSEARHVPLQGVPSQAPNQPYVFGSGSDASANVTPTTEFSFRSSWTPTNRPDGASTIPSLQGQLDGSVSIPPFYGGLPAQSRRDSGYPKEEGTSPKRSPIESQPLTGRKRRRSEYAEPGSARAIYLEKNRKAASKCRSKQKMEQEALVEKARDYERTNRVLKAEVELLQAELRGIKDIVGQHANCPDRRMTQYLQREADRLAAAGMRPHYQ
jgi:cyclic AMP-dependent transcription factor ATF-2